MSENISIFEAELKAQLAEQGARIKLLEGKVEELGKLESVNARLAALLETQVTAIERQDKFIEKQSDLLAQQTVTIAKVSENLDTIGCELKDMKGKVSKLEDKVNDKIDNVTKEMRGNEKERNTAMRTFLSNVLFKVIFPAGATVGLIEAILRALKVIP